MESEEKTRKPRRTILQMRKSYRYISMLSDYGFKQTFGNEKNTLFLRKALEILLQLEKPIVNVEFIKNEKSGFTADGRGSLFDVVCKDAEGTVCVVEMQLNEVEYYFPRARFYAVHVYNTMVQKGGKYKFKDLKPIFIISFLAKNVFSTEHFYQVGRITNQYGEVMDEQTTYLVVELGKWDKKVDDIKTDLDKLIYLMKTTELVKKTDDFKEPDFFQEDWIQLVLKELDLIRMTPEQRLIYEMNMARKAYEEMALEKEIEEAVKEERERTAAALEQAEKEKNKALEQVKKEKAAALEQIEIEKEQVQNKLIKNLILSNAMSLAQIAQIVNEPLKKVEAIAEELNK